MALLLTSLILLPFQGPSLTPYALRCESLTKPLGIARTLPEFSWKLKATGSGQQNLRQTAYEVKVGVQPGGDNLWDSGRVEADTQYGVTFAGKPLASGTSAYWSVRVWDAAGNASEWSKPEPFSVGLLSESDWKSKWIGWDGNEDATTAARPFANASWIWSSDEDPLNAAVGRKTLTRDFSLATKPTTARFILTVDDNFVLTVNGKEIFKSENVYEAWKTPKSIDLAAYLQAGANSIRIEAENTTVSAAGVIGTLVVDGTTALLTDGSWLAGGKPVTVVAPYGGGPWGKFAEGKVLRPSTLFSKSVQLDRKLVSATAHVTALGLVDLSVNGKRVSDDRFTPGWTNYNKRVYSRTYDISKALKNGSNLLSLEVGDGWYSGYVGYGRQRGHYGDHTRARAQFELIYSDGSRETIGTDESWQAATGSTVVQDFLVGEEYVAKPTSVRTGRPYVVSDVKGAVEPFPGVPVLPYDHVKPIKIVAQGDGYMLDFGQNLAGFAHLKARGKPGQKVQMQFLEALNPDGSPYTANLRSARATDAYTFGSDQVEEWEPRFTFHGFRFVKLTGLGRKPSADEFTAVAISSATPETGTFECSDPMLTKLAKNAWWTQKMNFIDVPTDCPQRDERLGWTGDAQAYVRTAATYSDVQTFFRKWLVALDDDQRADGQFSKVAPTIMNEYDGGPAWADAGIICPWTIYSVYGDKRLLAEHYPAMRKFVEFTRKRSTAELLPPAQFHCFGDWLSVNADTPNEIIYEAYFAYTTQLLAQSARTLGYTEDAEQYEKLYADIKAAFNKAYVSPDGLVKGDTQTAYVLAIGFDLLSPEMRAKAADRLIAKIEERNWHLSTGFVGTRDLMRVLSSIGRNDVAFRLLHNKDYPSWGFEIVNGATTVWERWDGWTPEKGFQDPGMNSFAHYAYGAVMGWVFATVGGIDNATPGFGKVVIAPKYDPQLTWAKTSFESIRGPIRTSWKRANGKVTLTVEVPPNTTAEVRLPDGKTQSVGSGSYQFETTEK